MVSFEKKAGADKAYDEYEADGVRVFVAKNIRSVNGELNIVLKHFLFFKSLAVNGVQLMK